MKKILAGAAISMALAGTVIAAAGNASASDFSSEAACRQGAGAWIDANPEDGYCCQGTGTAWQGRTVPGGNRRVKVDNGVKPYSYKHGGDQPGVGN